jgi:hypothetical protein
MKIIVTPFTVDLPTSQNNHEQETRP